MGEQRADAKPRVSPAAAVRGLSLAWQIVLVGVVTLVLICTWAQLNRSARVSLDEQLALRDVLEAHDDALAHLDMSLCRAQREANTLVTTRNPEAHARFATTSKSARAETLALREAVGAGELEQQLALLLEGIDAYAKAVANINRLQRRLGLGFGEAEGQGPKLAQQGRDIAARLRSAQLLELELELAALELAQRDFVASLDMRIVDSAQARAQSLRERLPVEVGEDTRAALEAYSAGFAELSATALELELAVNHASLKFGQLAPIIEASAALLDAANADATATIKRQRTRDARRSALLFGFVFLSTVAFLLVQLRAAQRFVARVRALSGVMQGVADGDLSRVAALRRAEDPGTDAISVLHREFNRMLTVLEELANAARAVAHGDLSIEIQTRGELQDTFRAMIFELRRNVGETREGAATIAAAAAEIGEAAAGQEQAATYQAEGIREVSIAMQRLAEAAGDISDAATEVLANADETRTRAEGLVSNFSELEEHLEEVSTLLQRIRDISDRSDLLALNGSLEATRAGEAGRGFALVASEMRRLAERVKGTVGGIRGAVANIDAATAKTAEATTDSRSLAKRTSAVAERIVELTEAQSAETEQVSAGVQDIALVLESSAAVSSETRLAASELEHRAKALTHLVARFELDVSERDAPDTPLERP